MYMEFYHRENDIDMSPTTMTFESKANHKKTRVSHNRVGPTIGDYGPADKVLIT